MLRLCRNLRAKSRALLVRQRNRLVLVKPDQLTQQHFRQRQTVLHLCQCHLGLVDAYADAQAVALRGHTLVDHLLHVALQSTCQYI